MATAMSTMDSMKRPPRQKMLARCKAATLVLTPALVQDAPTLVSIYDRIDWDQVRGTQCDTVHLSLQSAADVQAANRILLEMAAGALDVRNDLIWKIKRAFQAKGFQMNSGKTGKKGSGRQSINNIDKLLADLIATQDTAPLCRLCIQASLLHRKISAKAWKKQQRLVNTGAGKTPPPAPMTVSNTSWLGPADDHWISVPTRLAFAEPFVGLCRRISEVNTGETTLQLKPGEEYSLRQHQRLLNECKPLSYRATVGDSDPPYWYKLQKILNDFVPALRKLISTCLDQGEVTGLVELKKTTAPAVAEVQPDKKDPTRQNTGEILPAREKGNASEHTELSGKQSALKGEREPVKIEINQIYAAFVKSVRIAETGPANALLALAALADSGRTELTINTGEFVSLSHRSEKEVAKKWGKNKEWLEEERIGITVKPVRDGVWHLSGFQIFLHESVNSQKIKDHLQGQPARVRGKTGTVS